MKILARSKSPIELQKRLYKKIIEASNIINESRKSYSDHILVSSEIYDLIYNYENTSSRTS